MAVCKAVSPLKPMLFGFAPKARSNETIFLWPNSIASFKGVSPFLESLFVSASLFKRNKRIC